MSPEGWIGWVRFGGLQVPFGSKSAKELDLWRIGPVDSSDGKGDDIGLGMG